MAVMPKRPPVQRTHRRMLVRGKGGRDVKLFTHSNLVLWLTMNGSVPPVFPYDFMVCTWYFPFYVWYLHLWENIPIRTSATYIYLACKVDVKSLCTPWRTPRGIRSLLTSARGWVKLSASRPADLPPEKESQCPLKTMLGGSQRHTVAAPWTTSF